MKRGKQLQVGPGSARRGPKEDVAPAAACHGYCGIGARRGDRMQGQGRSNRAGSRDGCIRQHEAAIRERRTAGDSPRDGTGVTVLRCDGNRGGARIACGHHHAGGSKLEGFVCSDRHCQRAARRCIDGISRVGCRNRMRTGGLERFVTVCTSEETATGTLISRDGAKCASPSTL